MEGPGGKESRSAGFKEAFVLRFSGGLAYTRPLMETPAEKVFVIQTMQLRGRIVGGGRLANWPRR